MAPTILCIEDSKTIQKAVEIAFAYEGFQVVPALTPAEGLQKAQQLQPALVLLDTSLPGANAYELCQSLRQNPSTASVPVIMLAGTVEAFDQAKAQSVGCTDHLPKPFETKVLIEKARTLTGIAAQPVAAAPAVAPPLPTPPAPAAPALAPVAPRPPAPPAMPAIAPPAPAAPFAAPPRPAAPPPAMPAAAPRPPAPPAPAGFAWQPAPAMAATPVSPPLAASPPAVAPPAAPSRAAFDPFGLSLDDASSDDVDISFEDVGNAPLADITLEPPPRPAAPPPPPPAPAAPAPPPAPVAPAVAVATPPAAAPLAELTPGAGVSQAQLSAAVREIIEQVVWEVVPELAETLIREELDRLLRERGAT